jgi:hypothetical protein
VPRCLLPRHQDLPSANKNTVTALELVAAGELFSVYARAWMTSLPTIIINARMGNASLDDVRGELHLFTARVSSIDIGNLIPKKTKKGETVDRFSITWRDRKLFCLDVLFN